MLIPRILFGFFLVAFIFHTMGFHLLTPSFIDRFSDVGFFRDVINLRSDPLRHHLANAFAEHMILSMAYMIFSILLFLFLIVRDFIARFGAISDRYKIPISLFLSVGVFIAVGSYFILSGSHSSFANTDRRFAGMPFWWVISMTTFMWWIIPPLLIGAIKDPDYVWEKWKL